MIVFRESYFLTDKKRIKLRANIIICLCVFAISFTIVRSTGVFNEAVLYGQQHTGRSKNRTWLQVECRDFDLRIFDIGPDSRIMVGKGDKRHETVISQIASYGFNDNELILYVRDIYGYYFYIDRSRNVLEEKNIRFDEYRWITPSDIENPHSKINVKLTLWEKHSDLSLLLLFIIYFLLNVAMLRKFKVKRKTRIMLLSRIPLFILILQGLFFISDLSRPQIDIKTENLNLKIDEDRLIIFSGDTLFLSSREIFPNGQFYLKNIPVYNTENEMYVRYGMQADLWAYNDSDIAFKWYDIWYKIKRMHNADNNSYIAIQECTDKIEGNDSYTIIYPAKKKTKQEGVLYDIDLVIALLMICCELIVVIVGLVKLVKMISQAVKNNNKVVPL